MADIEIRLILEKIYMTGTIYAMYRAQYMDDQAERVRKEASEYIDHIMHRLAF